MGRRSSEHSAGVVHAADLAPRTAQQRRRAAKFSAEAHVSEHDSRELELCDAAQQEADEYEGKAHEVAKEESVGVILAMSLIVICFLALVGYVGYHLVVAENHLASRMASRELSSLLDLASMTGFADLVLVLWHRAAS